MKKSLLAGSKRNAVVLVKSALSGSEQNKIALKKKGIRVIRIEEQIEPKEAEMLIESYLRKGLDEALIAEKLEPLGPPREWTYKHIKIIKERFEEKE